MVWRIEARTSALHGRRCVACGFDGPSVHHPSADHCERCGCDFLERPPRSYAEMEGLLEGTADDAADWRDLQPPLLHVLHPPHRILGRWISFAVLTVAGALLGALMLAVLVRRA